jgi:adenylate cyclase
MALSKTLTKSVLTRHRGALADTVASINEELLREADEDMGVTMLIVLLDAATGVLAMVNAGHENPILVRADGSAESVTLHGGPPFCVCDFPYPEEHARLRPGETLVMITDGVTEAQDGSGALFGTRRAVDIVAGAADRSAAEQVDRLRGAVAAFEGEKEASDDLTIVAVRYLGGGTA